MRLLLADYDEESLTVYTDGFRAYDLLETDEDFYREAVIHGDGFVKKLNSILKRDVLFGDLSQKSDFFNKAHGDGEYIDGDAHVNTCESHSSLARRWLSSHRGVSKDKLTTYLRLFQLRRRILRKPSREALKQIVREVL